MDYLEKKITDKSYEYKIDNIGSPKKSIIIEASDVFFRENRSFKGMGMQWLMGGIFIIFTLISQPQKGGWNFVIFLIFGGGVGLAFIYNYIAPKKEMILDRLHGLVTMPGFMWAKSKTVAFNDGEGVINSYMAGDTMRTTLFFKTKKGVEPKAAMNLSDHYREESWNFTVWYMDKNRPLPPGSAFDPYRQKDFERRKAVGFPKPLYPSDIPTPEATPEQQAERERIGGW